MTTGCSGFLRGLDNALHAQQLRPVRRTQQIEEHLHGIGFDWPVMGQGEGADGTVMPVDIVVVMVAVGFSQPMRLLA